VSHLVDMLGHMRAHLDDRLAAVAAKQHRIFSRAQAISAGASPYLIDHRVRDGDWLPVGTGAFAFRGAAPDWHGVAEAAIFDSGHCARISHGGAGRLLHYPGYWQNGVEILVPRALDHRCEIARVHESRRFDRIPFTKVDGLPVTTPEATVVLLAGGMRMARLGWFVDDLITDKRLVVPKLHEVAEAIGGRGVSGSARLKAVLAERLPGDPIPESRLERMFLAFCDANGIRRPEWQCPLPWAPTRGRVDGMFRPERVIVEVDGRRWHTRVADLERDHRRDLQAAAMGFRVVRITYLMMRFDRPFLREQLTAALRVAAA
jgi:hypothetical protein